jgi:hypothetical protein
MNQRTCRFKTASSTPAEDLNTASISSRETFAVSGTRYVAQKYARKQAIENVINVVLKFHY